MSVFYIQACSFCYHKQIWLGLPCQCISKRNLIEASIELTALPGFIVVLIAKLEAMVIQTRMWKSIIETLCLGVAAEALVYFAGNSLEKGMYINFSSTNYLV